MFARSSKERTAVAKDMRKIGSILILLAVMTSATAHADARLASIFQDNMVLQREKPVPVWGWAPPGTEVEVIFAGQKKQGQSNPAGYWKVMLDPLTASRAGRAREARIGDKTLSITNVLVGEVWLAAGQSNMLYPGPDEETGLYPHYVSPGTQGGKPEVRVTGFGWGASLEPMDDIDPAGRNNEHWQVLNENPPPAKMGPAYYFSRVVRDALDVPVGLVVMAVGGTCQTAWMARETLEAFPGKTNNYFQECLAGGMPAWEAFKQAETAWRETRKGEWPGSLKVMCYPTALYNTRIHPLAPFAARGVLWHQGEAGPGGPYGERLVAMARQWRTLFGQDLSFIWGTLTRSTAEPPPLTPSRSSYFCSQANVEIRKALPLFGSDPHVALVELYDLGTSEVHFLEKTEMGRRMGLAALNVAYGQNHVYTGPRMAETKIEGGRALVRFEQVGDGLVYQPSINGISGFYLCGKTNGSGRWGQVKLISKDTLEISHPDITTLLTVAWP